MQTNNITQLHDITPEEFKESILSDVRNELKNLSQHFKPVTPPEYLTRQETAAILKVSLVTLSDWNKKGILKPYRLGNLIRYKRTELDEALISINQKKLSKMKKHPFLVSLKALENKIDVIINQVKNSQLQKSGDIILDNADFMQMFKISSRTAQNWREEGIVPYSQVKGKIYYRLQDIRNLIDSHKKK